MGQEKLLELLNTYAKSSYEIDDNFTLNYIKEKIQFLDAWIQNNIEKTPRDLFRLTEEQLIENRNKITETEINNTILSEEESEGLTEEEIIEKKKDKILANQIKGEAFWKNSTQQLIDFFQEEFIPLLNENDTNNSEETKYSENMKIIKNHHRINVEDLNDNFELIAEGLKRIFKNVLSDEKGVYKNFFKLVLSDLMPLWENVLFLWIMYILKNTDFNAKPLIKYVYLNENDFFLSKKFDFSNNIQENITLLDIANKLKNYVHEYQNCNLVIIPIIRLNNYENNYYSQEAYPGIFYHPVILNNKLFKPNEKFIIYPFSTISEEGINDFHDGIYMTVTTEEKSEKNYFCLGKEVYGYTLNGDDLYYTAPFNNIHNLREICPKKYYNTIRTILKTNIEQDNLKLILKNFTIKCYDAFQENLENDKCEIGSITILNNTDITLNTITDLFKGYDILVQPALNCVFNYGPEISEKLHKISNFRTRIGKDSNLNIKNLKSYQGECISYYKYSLDEDYSYLIEYVPLKSENNKEDLIFEENLNSEVIQDYVGDVNSSTSLSYKDNDLLRKHFVWDNKKNNILEDKFVLRIGQHLEKETLIDSNKADLVNQYLKEKDRNFFDYDDNQEIIENNMIEKYYNNGTVEIGAYLNIPFIKNKNKRVTYYPDFLSHTYASNYIVPTQVVEYKDDTPDYFAYKKLYRDYTIDKDCYFKIYTKDGDEDFSNQWSIKMIEVISQQTPSNDSYFNQKEDYPPVEHTKTMDELYKYYSLLSEREALTDKLKKILPFFSQLCPTQSEISPKKIMIDQYRDPLRIQVKKDYSKIVNFFFNNLNDTEKAEIYNEITNSIFFNYKGDNIYPMIFTRSREINHNEGAPVGYVYDYSLSMICGISQSEIANNAISDGRINKSYWNKTGSFTADTVKKENFDLIYQSPQEYRGYYYEGDEKYYRAWLRTDILDNTDYSDWIAKWKSYGWGIHEIVLDSNKKYFELLYGGENEPWEDGIYPVIPISDRLDQNLYANATSAQQQSFLSTKIYYPLCKQAYVIQNGMKSRDLINVSNEPIVKTNFPQTQISTFDYEDEVLDEIYLKDYYDNHLLNYDGSQYIYNGFSSVSNFDITLNGQGQLNNPKTINFKTRIFGANIPLITQDESFNPSVPRASEISGNGWTENTNMYGTVEQNGEMIGVLTTKPKDRTPQNAEPQYTVGPWGTSSFKKINLGMDVQEYTQLSDSYEDIRYSKMSQASFNGAINSTIFPFLNIYYIPHLNYNTLQIRQYPHIFLYSQKTLFPDKAFFNNKKIDNDISYKIYNENKNISSLREFYKLLPKRNAKNIPYPFPKIKTTISINFKSDSIKPSLIKALDQVFEKNFISNYDYTDSGINWGHAQYGIRRYAHLPCFLDYFSESIYTNIKNTFKSEEFPIDTRQFQHRKASPIDIFESRYLYHNKYYNTSTSLDNIANRPLFYGIVENMQKSLKTIADGIDRGYTDLGTTKNFFKMNFKSIHEIEDNNPNEKIAYLNDKDSSLNIDTPLSYNENNQNIYSMNLQIIIHWFGPNGKYARKVLTRQKTADIPLSQDHFILGEYDFIYKKWTNNWEEFTYDNGYSFAQFENDLSNQVLFKQSAALTIDGQELNFEIYKNNGIDF